MCGIAGFSGPNGTKADLDRMIGTLKHRGPDDVGIFADTGIALAHARLSILDLSPAGHQPMSWDGGRFQIIFNGEIYNFAELRKDLVRSGVTFQSTSDTEVILALYAREGRAAFAKLAGMFAIALWDRDRQELVLARDRLGKKPLYVGEYDRTLLFASEPKAIFAHPSFPRVIDRRSIGAYFTYEYVPTPATIWGGLKKLEPGHMLIWKDGCSTKERFWTPDLHESSVSFPDALTSLDQLLAKSVEERLVADVPVGVLLSGGLDSSTVAYYAARAAGGKIKTFSIAFEEASFDESIYALAVAEHLGTDHHVRTVHADDMIAEIPTIADMLDEPMADASILPTYLLSRFVREEITVALGGDGGDELFAGYPTFQAAKFADLYRRLPRAIRDSVLAPLFSRFPESDRNMSVGFKLRRFANGIDADDWIMHQRWLGNFGGGALADLFLPAYADIARIDPWETLEPWRQEAKDLSRENAILWSYLRTYLLDEVLVKADRASMRASLELRAPFLDHRLVEEVFRMPYAWKQHGLTGKWMLKELMRGKLPGNIIDRPKKGFGVPLARWFRGELSGFLDETLSEGTIREMGLFRYETIARMIALHRSGRRDLRKELWTLVVFALWWKRWQPILKHHD